MHAAATSLHVDSSTSCWFQARGTGLAAAGDSKADIASPAARALTTAGIYTQQLVQKKHRFAEEWRAQDHDPLCALGSTVYLQTSIPYVFRWAAKVSLSEG